MTAERIAGVGAFVVVVAAVAIGFATIGPPQRMRSIDLDHRRVSDLQSIERDIHDPDLRRGSDRVTAPSRPRAGWPRDPATGQPYDYHREGDTRYRLCASFALPSDVDSPLYGTSGWRHGAGRTCYRLDSMGANQVFPETIMETSTTVAH